MPGGRGVRRCAAPTGACSPAPCCEGFPGTRDRNERSHRLGRRRRGRGGPTSTLGQAGPYRTATLPLVWHVRRVARDPDRLPGVGGCRYGVLPSVRESPCPYITLPASFEELLASRSRNTRKQLRKRQRELQAAGEVRLRTSHGGPDFERDFDSFLRVEASGWKGQQGTAIISNAASETLYRGFARERLPSGAGCGSIFWS